MKIRHHFQEEAETIQMAPLIDIVFLTLIFFMVTSVYATLESEVDIQLPTADTALQGERTQGEIFINLREDGSIVVNERTLTLEELQETLDRVAVYFPGGAVIVRGDRGAALGQAVQILDCCRKADIQNVAFAALPEEE
ncbi:MAG: Biopolymer transport protein ExbD [Candidatus Hydrogenedentes bacterium ADurb.Bin101]|jgi:biopolymer transport protein ExbD|nr:biopolymer transporter ExbD [Candidatus Hydrogenedentota bacterium]OQC07210.1 MAG: Biopolymer transport protein ExbD [Candidatus Hydrogenedentes bacterium ADurb.Bin101]HOC70273.1 biopolymer transporter ExbD [Candidatus Hydrogenedentota bacterium]HOH29722.1 biopolymer transporter ExbD [Candidatus Hydrogenedentota bacterium]